jgi:hypothetical protein
MSKPGCLFAFVGLFVGAATGFVMCLLVFSFEVDVGGGMQNLKIYVFGQQVFSTRVLFGGEFVGPGIYTLVCGVGGIVVALIGIRLAKSRADKLEPKGQ